MIDYLAVKEFTYESTHIYHLSLSSSLFPITTSTAAISPIRIENTVATTRQHFRFFHATVAAVTATTLWSKRTASSGPPPRSIPSTFRRGFKVGW